MNPIDQNPQSNLETVVKYADNIQLRKKLFRVAQKHKRSHITFCRLTPAHPVDDLCRSAGALVRN